MSSLAPPTADPLPTFDPLARLRGRVRRYIALDGLAAIAVAAAVTFWVWLAVDYGPFRLFGIDWVQEIPSGVRVVVRACVAAALAYVVVVRLILPLSKPLRPRDLALVLERRFGSRLGDRLLTAVEMADHAAAARLGYSTDLLRRAAREAADELDRLPIDDALDWPRLRARWRRVVVACVGPYVLAGLGHSLFHRTDPRDDFIPLFQEVSTLWAERNLMLADVIWPRQAHLEWLDAPASGEWRVSREAPAVRLRLRAVKWVIADAAVPGGWRAMTWDDLTADRLGRSVPPLPTELIDPHAAGPWTLDRIEPLLNRSEVRERLYHALGFGRYQNLLEVFDRLSVRASGPGRKTFRKLQVPERVEVRAWGANTGDRMELARGERQEFSGSLSDLKESVRFRARAADFSTPTLAVTLVPPPRLTALTSRQDRPAYLYHRGRPELLRGRQQQMPAAGVSRTGAVSKIDLPAGSNLIVSGTSDKPLAAVALKVRGDGGRVIPFSLDAAATGFIGRFDAVTTAIDGDLDLTDAEGVTTTRRLQITPIPDAPPEVKVGIPEVAGRPVIRKLRDGQHMATPIARLPVVGTVAEAGPFPGGVTAIEYQAEWVCLDADGDAAARAVVATGAMIGGVNGPSAVIAAGRVAELSRAQLAALPRPVRQVVPLETYRAPAVEPLDADELARRLGLPPPEAPPYPTRVAVDPPEALDLQRHLPDLKSRDEQAIQPRYRLRLTVVARDNNIETGPGVGDNVEPPFTVLIVSEPELLVEVALEEEQLHFNLEDAVQRLREARQQLDRVSAELPTMAEDRLTTLAARGQELLDTTARSRDTARMVFEDYSRIRQELELNRVLPRMIAKVRDEIVGPLAAILADGYPPAEEALDEYRLTLEAGRRPDEATAAAARRQLDDLIARLNRVLAAMGDVTTINKLIATLREIEKSQSQDVGGALKRLLQLQKEKMIRDLDKQLEGLND